MLHSATNVLFEAGLSKRYQALGNRNIGSNQVVREYFIARLRFSEL